MQQPPLSSFNMQPPLSSFMQSSPAAALKQAAMKAKQFVSGATNAFSNPVASNPVKPNRFASSGSGSGSGGVASDGEYKMFTRAELNNLYGNKSGNRGFSLMNTNFFNLGNGPIEHIIMMFQLYIALIAALSRLSMNAAGMGASFLFGNETLINLFSIFLENALNLILNRNVGELTLDQLQKLLEDNKPKLQQMSALLINAMTPLALGLSDICSKIATDWITNVLPGLLKNTAIGLGNAAQAGIDVVTMGTFGEILNIFSISIHTLGGMMNIIAGLQRNAGNFSQAFNTVLTAQKKLMDLKDLFSKSPSEIAAAATAAVIPEAAQKLANRAVDTLMKPGNSFLNAAAATATSVSPSLVQISPTSAPASSPAPADFEERLRKLESAAAAGATMPTAPALDPLSNLNSNLGNLGRGIANAGIQGAKTIGSKMMRAASTFSDFLKTPKGEPVIDGEGNPIKTSVWNRISERLFKSAMSKIRDSGKYGKVNETIVQYVLRNPDILIPFLPFPYNIAAVAFRLVQTYLRHVRKPNDAATTGAAQGGALVGGSGIRYKNKSIKYKNKKHLKRYMSNLRRKTEKKELQLLNGIRDLKSISSL